MIAALKYSNFLERLYWNSLFWCVKHNLIDTWDYQWVYALFVNQGICTTPNKNLVVNIGFGKDSTHTKKTNKAIRRALLDHMNKVSHPNSISVDSEADQYILKHTFGVSLKYLWKILLIIPYNMYRNI
jgi:hypothetical protein